MNFSIFNVTSSSTLPMFFLFGLLAGFSTCTALLGGIILSLKNKTPIILFNIGRIISYPIMGAILGLLGTKLQFSPTFSAILVITVSILMIWISLPMIGIKGLPILSIPMPKFLHTYINSNEKIKNRYLPFFIGAATFLLPCGFTLTTEGLALISSSPLRGSLIMLFFALGTLIPLLILGFTSIKFKRSANFSIVAGGLILLFALFNINSQLNVLGLPSLTNINNSNQKSQDNDLPPIIDGKQVIKMNASSAGYVPNYFKVRVNVPVKWEVTDTGTSGCTNAIISKDLFLGQISLTPGKTSIQEFTPKNVGKYKFSCWMGMVTGIIEVVDPNNVRSNSLVNQAQANTAPVFESGAKGCGCKGL